MPATDIILQKPFVLISPDGSTIGVDTSGGSLLSGTIKNIYETSDMYAIEDVVLYSDSGSDIINYEGVNYVLLREEKIFSKEVIPP